MSRDTTIEARRVQRELFRAATPEKRVRLALSLSDSAIALSRRGIATAHPDWSQTDRDLEFVRLHYGQELAEKLRRHLAHR